MLNSHDVLIKHELQRSRKWSSFRKRIIKQRNGVCEFSGVTTDLEAHHIVPFHIGVLLGKPHLELEERNIIILSGSPVNYHLLIGHLNSFQSFNPFISKCTELAHLNNTEIKNNSIWRELRDNRPKTWEKMSLDDKDRLILLIESLYS